MSIDLSQFHQVFFEESFEGLDAMETSLMEIDPTDIDSETINTIFRAAHSIKGGSATFGFSNVAEFTHILETLLDEVRSGVRGLSRDDVDLYLQSVDCLRDLLTGLQDAEEADLTLTKQLTASFQAILDGDQATPEVSADSVSVATTEPAEATAAIEAAEQASTANVWTIRFVPEQDILRTGNEPLRMFRELSELGNIKVESICTEVPTFAQMDVEACYLGWNITLTGDINEADIHEVFEWVVDESELDIANAGSISANWNIHFKPEEDVLRTGNEPLRIIRELADYGELTSVADVSAVPSWSSMNPESCYLGWDLVLSDTATKEQIDEAFEWVVDESDLIITQGAAVISESVTEVQAGIEIVAEPELVQPSSVAAIEPVVETAAPATPEPIETAVETKKPAKKANSESASIRVGIDKIDSLINMVGELVITQSMLGQLGSEFKMDSLPKLIEGLGQLEQNTRELQESVMRIRMLPISFAFSRFPRMVRDLGKRLEKNIELVLEGETTELDKTVMEKIGDPLVHLVRNSVDHGIEMPADRLAAGKSDTGLITLNAYHQGGNIVIDIIDDGKGLDKKRLLEKAIENGLVDQRDAAAMTDDQIHDLIFQPGFSTAKEVSDVSGRGVGMDVVRRNIQELNGTVEIASKEGFGSKITIRLPLTLAILDGQLVRVGSDVYIFPLVSIVESILAKKDMMSHVAGGCDVFRLRNEYVPVIRLYDIFNIKADSQNIEESLLVVVECDGEKVGILVDELEAQQQVVIKSLEQNYQRVEGVSGATILGDGTVALILDIPGLVKLAGVNHQIRTQVNSLSATQAQTQH